MEGSVGDAKVGQHNAVRGDEHDSSLLVHIVHTDISPCAAHSKILWLMLCLKQALHTTKTTGYQVAREDLSISCATWKSYPGKFL